MMAINLEVRRIIHASAEHLFAVWTEPQHLRAWWGPRDVSCPAAEVDLRVGGRFRIANQLPDGRIIWISGAFEAIEPPRRLIYSWQLEPGPDAIERVTVSFEPQGAATEVIVQHERIADRALRDQHEAGWQGCLDGLARYCWVA
jgi:uncharacterized protein YndB with AHSA1/START domain